MQENNHSIRKGRTDAVPLSDEEMVSQVVVTTVENLWEAVNQLTRLKKSKKEEYMVTIFGSARIMPETHDYDRVRKLAKKLSDLLLKQRLVFVLRCSMSLQPLTPRSILGYVVFPRSTPKF